MAKPSVLKQYLATITCNLLAFNVGNISSFGGRNFMLLTSEYTPIESGPLSIAEASLAVSMPSLGSIIGALIYTIFMDRISRKISLASIAILHLLSWSMLLVTSDLYSLFAARCLQGVTAGAVLKVVPIYVTEIADDRVRGTLNAMLDSFINTGFLFGLISPSYFDYFDQIKVNIIPSILFLILFNFFLVTPEPLSKTNQQNAVEISTIQTSLEMRNIDQSENARDRIENKNEDTSLSLSDFHNKAAKKAIIIALILGALNQFCGASSMIFYTNKILEEAGTNLSSSTASIIIGSIQLFANCVATILVDHAGRKFLMILSTMGTAFGLNCMGLFEVYKEQLDAYRWIPIIAFSIVIFSASIGIFPLTFVIMSEIAPPKIKNAVSFLCLEVIFILAFAQLSFYPILTQELGSHVCMFTFAGFCLIGAVFYLVVLPETKGKSYKEIIAALEK